MLDVLDPAEQVLFGPRVHCRGAQQPDHGHGEDQQTQQTGCGGHDGGHPDERREESGCHGDALVHSEHAELKEPVESPVFLQKQVSAVLSSH